MNPRERTLATVVLGALAVVVLYYGVNTYFIQARAEAVQRQQDLAEEAANLEETIGSREKLAERWSDIASRTLSFDATAARNQFDLDLKRRAKEHHLESLDFRTQTANMKIGGKDLKKIVCRVSGEGSYTDVMNFIWSLYDTPYYCQITKLALSPMELNRRRDMKIHSLVVETPLLSPYKDINVPEAAAAKAADALADLGQAPEGPARPELPQQGAYSRLQERNVFLVYVPAPENTVTVKNEDSEAAKIKLEFEWDGKKEEQPELAVEGMSTKETPIFLGDVATAWAEYADGHKIGPERFDKSRRKPWTFELKAHTPPPVEEPKFIDLAVQNQDKGRVFVTVEVTPKDGPAKKLPQMIIEPNARVDVDKFEAREVRVAAAYESGEPGGEQSYSASDQKQTFVVPKKGEKIPEPKPREVEDPPADPNMTLTAILAYPGDDRAGGGEKFPGQGPEEGEKAAEGQPIPSGPAATSVAAASQDAEGGIKKTYDSVPTGAGMVSMDSEGAAEAAKTDAATTDEASEKTDAVPAKRPVGLIEEFIALNARTHKREIKLRGNEVDKGELIVIHPLGGVVRYRDSGNCYFYPLGEKFTSRVLMEKASTPEEFVAAIDKASIADMEKVD